MTDYAVIGCPDCDWCWVVSELGSKDTVGCPRCGHTRSTQSDSGDDRIRTFAEAGDWEAICELRSRILSDRAGFPDSMTADWADPDNFDDYGLLEDEIERSLPDPSECEAPLFSNRLDQEVSDSLKQYQRRQEILSSAANRYLQRRVGKPVRDLHDDETPDRSLEPLDGDTGSISVRNLTDVKKEPQINADCSPSTFWERLATSEEFQNSLVGAVRALLSKESSRCDRLQLVDAGVTAADGGIAGVLAALDRPPENEHHQDALDLVAQIGQDGSTLLGHRPLEDIVSGPLALLDSAAEWSPALTIAVGNHFQDLKRKQREDILWLLAAVGRVADLTIATTPITARWLYRTHREDLPQAFSEYICANRPPESRIETQVREAITELSQTRSDKQLFKETPMAVLRDLQNAPGKTLPFDQVREQRGVSDSRVSQVKSTLTDLGLIREFGQRAEKQIELTATGTEFLSTVREEIGRQQTFDDMFSETGQSPQRDVYPKPHKRGPYRTAWLGWAGHHGPAAAAAAGDIVSVNEPIPADDSRDGNSSERRTRYISFNDERDEAVVSVFASTSMQYIVSMACGLASREFLETALPDSRLDQIDRSPEILRDARCLGALSDEALDDPSIFRKELIKWGADIEQMTTALKNEEYDDRNRFCGEILRSAHGLAGTIVHLLDVAGIDVVRELRLPSLTHDQMAPIARTVTISVAIQSRYGAFASYRQLFENRPVKRQTALSPTVDAEDQVGEIIGSVVVRGTAATEFESHLEGMLSTPAPLHEDAPEFAVRVDLSRPTRESYTAAVNRQLSRKNMRATPEAVSLFRAFGTPYTAAKAVGQLQAEDEPRTIRLDEVRVALSALDPDHLLPDAPSSVSQTLAALLRSSQILSQRALAEKANISVRSLRRHLDTLLAMDFVREVDGGYRLALPFRDSERGEQIVPAAVDGSMRAQQLIFEVVLSVVDRNEAGRLAVPDDPLGKPFCGPILDGIEPLRRALPELQPYLSIAFGLCGYDKQDGSTVSFGPDPSQESICELA